MAKKIKLVKVDNSNNSKVFSSSGSKGGGKVTIVGKNATTTHTLSGKKTVTSKADAAKPKKSKASGGGKAGGSSSGSSVKGGSKIGASKSGKRSPKVKLSAFNPSVAPF